jgi:hypothetical protein
VSDEDGLAARHLHAGAAAALLIVLRRARQLVPALAFALLVLAVLLRLVPLLAGRPVVAPAGPGTLLPHRERES